MVHRQSGLHAMFSKHSCGVGSLWIPATRATILQVSYTGAVTVSGFSGKRWQRHSAPLRSEPVSAVCAEA